MKYYFYLLMNKIQKMWWHTVGEAWGQAGEGTLRTSTEHSVAQSILVESVGTLGSFTYMQCDLNARYHILNLVEKEEQKGIYKDKLFFVFSENEVAL